MQPLITRLFRHEKTFLDKKDELLEVAKQVHELLDLRQYSRSDFIVAQDGIYFLEVNTLPGLGDVSPFITGLKSVGASREELVTHLLADVYS